MYELKRLGSATLEGKPVVVWVSWPDSGPMLLVTEQGQLPEQGTPTLYEGDEALDILLQAAFDPSDS